LFLSVSAAAAAIYTPEKEGGYQIREVRLLPR